MHTVQSLLDLIQERYESDLPDKVLECLMPFHTKPVTKRILDALPGGRERWMMSRRLGWTEISNKEYGRNGQYPPEAMRLILVRSEASVPLDISVVEKDNPAYFSGRRERNHKRMEARNDLHKLEQVVSAMNEVTELKAKLDTAVGKLRELTAYETVFEPDSLVIAQKCGF